MTQTLRGFVANTDRDWFDFLAARNCEEVNFWQPSGSSKFAAVPEGSPFFFRLKSPYRKIGGFGYLSHHSILPDWLAWDTFREGNGAPDFSTMRARVERYRKKFAQGAERLPYRVGCIMIINPVFFPESLWIDDAADFSPNVVRGKTYNLTIGEGKRIFEACLERSRGGAIPIAERPRYGDPIMVRPRLGQCSFRIAVMEAYGSACAVTTEHSLPTLDAAHIRPYSEGGSHAVSNGVLLRSDIHRLFDKGYVTISPEHRFEVGRRLREDFANGKSYYKLHGQPLQIPQNPHERPRLDDLSWHNQNQFLG